MSKCNCIKSLKKALQKERNRAYEYALSHPDPFSSKLGYSIAETLLQIEIELDIQNIKNEPIHLWEMGKFYYFIAFTIMFACAGAVGVGFHHLMGNWGLCFSFPIQIFMGIAFARLWFR